MKDDANWGPDAQPAEARFEALLELAPDAIVIVDGDGRIVLVNAQTEAMFDYARAELLGNSVDLLLPDQIRHVHATHRANYLQQPRNRSMGAGLELFARRRDGTELAVEISLSPVPWAGHWLVVSAIRDVTHRKRIEAALNEQAQANAALEERQRLARELHDSVSQALYGIALGARTARTQLDRDPQLAIEPLEYVIALAKAGLAEMKALIFELRPESLESEGLVGALHKQAEALKMRFGLTVEVQLGAEPGVAFPVKEALYRVAQEALHNVAKHAKATVIHLELSTDADWLILEIADNGVGFDADLEYPGHLGLQSMRERIGRIGGRLVFTRAWPDGMRVRAEVPIVAGAASAASGPGVPRPEAS